jgi:hypothetical protein
VGPCFHIYPTNKGSGHATPFDSLSFILFFSVFRTAAAAAKKSCMKYMEAVFLILCSGSQEA